MDWTPAPCPCKTHSVPYPGPYVIPVQVKLRRWANDMYARFGKGTHVYLVGSALTSATPSDCDISIVMPPGRFLHRYGSLDGEWRNHVGLDPHPDQLKLMRECAKRVHMAQLCLDGMLPIDLKIMSRYEQDECHAGKPRLQLDTIEKDTTGTRMEHA